MRSPVIVFAYNRPDHLEKTLTALAENHGAGESDLFVFVDGPKNTDGIALQKQVVETAGSFRSRFRSMTLNVSQQNKGLAKSVIGGVTGIIRKYGRVIVVEDDSVSAKCFLNFMNEALDYYENDPSIWSVGGYTVPLTLPDGYPHEVLKTQRSSSYAWATWHDRWDRIDWSVGDYRRFRRSPALRRGFNRWGEDRASMLDDQMNGRIDSWAIRFDYAMYKNGMYNIIPAKSLIRTIGRDGSGTHNTGVSAQDDNFRVELADAPDRVRPSSVEVDEAVRREFIKPFRLSALYRAKRYLLNDQPVMAVYDRLLPYYCLLFPKKAVKTVYRQTFGKKLDLENPRDLNEKINWLKLIYKDDPLVIRCADKYAVRSYLESKGYGEYLNDLYGVYDKPNQIDWERLPEQFALKFNKGAGMNLICTDKSSLDIPAAVSLMKGWYKNKSYYRSCELHYRKAKPKIICEKFLGDSVQTLPEDYKIYCLNGNPVFMLICLERAKTLKRLFFDKDFRLLDINDDYQSVETLPEKPQNFEKMFEIARDLSTPFPIVRIDFFESEGRLYIGEMTFTPQGGYLNYRQEWLDRLGDLLVLPK